MSVKSSRIGSILIALVSLSISLLSVNTVSAATEGEKDTLVVIEQDGVEITYAEAIQMLDYLLPQQRNHYINNPSDLEPFLVSKMTQKAMATEAEALGVDKKEKVAWKIEESRRTILISALLEHQKSKIDIPDTIPELAKEYYQAHPEEFMSEDFVEVAHILFRSDARTDKETDEKQKMQADRVLEELRGGASFAKAAAEYSDEKSSGKSGGYLGRYGRGKFVPEFEKAAFALEESGQISDVIKSTYGYHIIKLISKTPAVLRPFSEFEETLVENMTQKYIKASLEEYAGTFASQEKKTLYLPVLDMLSDALEQ